MKQWHATVNTWSIDGLPGMKQYNDKASPELVEKAMKEFNFKPSLAVPVAQSGPRWTQHPAAMVALGFSIGVLATCVLRDNKNALTLFLPTFT